MTASLSDSADQLLDALEHVVARESPAGRWLVALAEHERDLAEAATGNAGLDLDELRGAPGSRWAGPLRSVAPTCRTEQPSGRLRKVARWQT